MKPCKCSASKRQALIRNTANSQLVRDKLYRKPCKKSAGKKQAPKRNPANSQLVKDKL
jgi:hypothetical protein